MDIYGVYFFRGCWNFFGCGVGMEGRLVEIMDDFVFRRLLEVVGSFRICVVWVFLGVGVVGMKGKEVFLWDNFCDISWCDF